MAAGERNDTTRQIKRHLAPSILAADFMQLGAQVQAVEAAGVDYLHFDVMDGMFVPSISFGLPVLQCVRKGTGLKLDVHLMVERPERYVERFAECGADLITIHYEATEEVDAAIGQIRACGKRVGLALKPATPAEAVRAYLPSIDLVMPMTVEPGSGGQSYIPDCLDKVAQLRGWIDAEGLTCDVEVDGGVREDNIALMVQRGANVIVAGSAVFCSDAKECGERAKRLLGLLERA